MKNSQRFQISPEVLENEGFMSPVRKERRNYRFRSFGFLSLSLISHSLLFIGMMMKLDSQPKEAFGLPDGNGGETVYMDLLSPGGSENPPPAVTDDQVKPIAPPASLVATQDSPVQMTQAPEPMKTVEAPQKTEAPVTPKEVKSAPVTPISKPKPAIAKKVVAPQKTAEESDIQQALIAARTKDQPEAKVEKAQPAPVVAEKPIPEQEMNQPEENTQELAEVEEPQAEQTQEAAPIAAPLAAQPVAPTQESADEIQSNEAGTGPAGSRTANRPGGYGIPTGTQIVNAENLISKPGNRPPSYPQQDRLLGREGTPIVIGQVMPDGSVGEVFLEKRSGSPYMDEAALKAFKNWKFQPGQGGFARKAFQFRLAGPAQENPARLRTTR